MKSGLWDRLPRLLPLLRHGTWHADDFDVIPRSSVDASFLVLSNQASAADYLWRFFVPTLLGNAIGGVALVAALNYGQVASEVKE